jgi:hypothetical protein
MPSPNIIIAELHRLDQDRMRSLSSVKILHSKTRPATAPIPLFHLNIEKPSLTARRFTHSARCHRQRNAIQYP